MEPLAAFVGRLRAGSQQDAHHSGYQKSQFMRRKPGGQARNTECIDEYQDDGSDEAQKPVDE